MAVAESFRFTALAFCAVSALLPSLAACTVEPDPAPLLVPPPAAPDAREPVAFPVTGEAASSASIVTGELLTSDPGRGAGLFVIYLGAGVWRIFTTCDTDLTGYTCGYAYTLRSPGGTLAEPVLDRKDGSMQLVRYTEGYDVAYIASTAIDGLTARVDPPGAPLEVAVWLDNQPDARLLYWVAPEGVQQGARTNPTRFVPTAP